MSVFQKQVTQWLRDNQYTIVQHNEVVSGQTIQYTVPIHAMTSRRDADQILKKLMYIGIAFVLFFGVSLSFSFMRSFTWVTVGLVLCSILGGVYIYFKKEQDVQRHVWVEIKEGKIRVNQAQVQKLYAVYSGLQNENRKKNSTLWSPRYLLLFSSTGFSSNALKWAQEYNIDCWEWNPEAARFVRGQEPFDLDASSRPSTVAFAPTELLQLLKLKKTLYSLAILSVCVLTTFFFFYILSASKERHTKETQGSFQVRSQPTPDEPVDLQSHQLWKRAVQAEHAQQFTKSAMLYGQLQQTSFPLFPKWRMLAYESSSLSRSHQRNKAYLQLQSAERAYIRWKKRLRRQGGKLLYYMRLESHKSIGDAHWYYAKTSTRQTQMRHLGEVWIEWPLNPHAGQAQEQWWVAYSNPQLRKQESWRWLYKAGRSYALDTYRNYRRAERILAFLTRKANRRWRRKAYFLSIQIAARRGQWSKVKKLASRFQRIFRKGYERRVRDKALQLYAKAQLYQRGMSAFKTALRSISSQRTKVHMRAHYDAIQSLLQYGRYTQAESLTQWLIQHGNSWFRKHALWYQGVLHYVQNRYAQAYTTWSTMHAQSHRTPWKMRLLYWMGYAAWKAQNTQESTAAWSTLCTDYPLSQWGMRACKRIQVKLRVSNKEQDSWPPQKHVYKRWKHLQSGDFSRCLELRRILYLQARPSPELSQRTAQCYARHKKWGLSFQILKNHRMHALWTGKWSKTTMRLMFPRPRQVWPSVQKIAQEYKLDPLLVMAIMRRESDFKPHETFAARIGLMGLDPLWTSKRPFAKEDNLRIGLHRIAQLSQRYTTELGIAAYRGYEKEVRLVYRKNRKAPREMLPELLPYKSWEYIRGHRSSILWYYQIYKWLYR